MTHTSPQEAPPVVSVCIVTYQHAPFIRQAIEGALAQETDFPIEILVGEDGSSDGTREICQEVAAKHPEKIRLILQDRANVILVDGRPRGHFNFRTTLWQARGEFIAVCEGDDYWTDPKKLQLQVDYLRNNPDCVACFHDAHLVDPEGNTKAPSYFQSEQEKFDQLDVITTLMSRQPTGSMVFRRQAYAKPLPEWYVRRPSDLAMDILLTNHGKLGFIRRNMSAYRIHQGGMWSGEREASRIVELIVRYKILLADPFFLANYHDVMLRKIDEFMGHLFTRADTDSELVRLEKIVVEQTAYITTLRTERDALRRQLGQMPASPTTSPQR